AGTRPGSGDGTSTSSRSTNSRVILVSSSRASVIGYVLRRQQVVQQSVVRLAVDPMAVPLAPDVAKVELLERATRRQVDLHGPRADHFEPQLLEPVRQDAGRGAPGEAAMALATQHGPQR